MLSCSTCHEKFTENEPEVEFNCGKLNLQIHEKCRKKTNKKVYQHKRKAKLLYGLDNPYKVDTISTKEVLGNKLVDDIIGVVDEYREKDDYESEDGEVEDLVDKMMFGPGWFKLVAYGTQDIYRTGEPQITKWKVKYKRGDKESTATSDKGETMSISIVDVKSIFHGNTSKNLEKSISYSKSLEEDIKLIMSQVKNISKEDAKKALKESNGDIVDAVMKLTVLV